MQYTYQAKDAQGRTVTGSLEAHDERAAATCVRALGYFPMSLSPDRKARAGVGAGGGLMPGSYGLTYTPSPSVLPQRQEPRPQGNWFLLHVVYPLWTGVPLRDLAVFYRQLAALLNAGVPVQRSLDTLCQQMPNITLRKSLHRIERTINAGGMLSEGMALYPWIFVDYHRALVRAGELNGDLPSMFLRISATLEQEFTLRSNIKKELFMPWMTLFATFLLPPLFLFFIGQAKAYFTTAVLPMLEILLVIGGVYMFTRLASQFKTAYDFVAANLWTIGPTVRMIALGRFARTLASLYAAGVTVPVSVGFAARACGNNFLAGRILTAVPWMESGRGIVESLVATRVFPPMVVTMLSTGEETGSLDTMMDKVGEYYEQEAAFRLHKVSIQAGVIATVLMAIKVLFILIQFYGGYFNSMLTQTGN